MGVKNLFTLWLIPLQSYCSAVGAGVARNADASLRKKFWKN